MGPPLDSKAWYATRPVGMTPTNKMSYINSSTPACKPDRRVTEHYQAEHLQEARAHLADAGGIRLLLLAFKDAPAVKTRSFINAIQSSAQAAYAGASSATTP